MKQHWLWAGVALIVAGVLLSTAFANTWAAIVAIVFGILLVFTSFSTEPSK